MKKAFFSLLIFTAFTLTAFAQSPESELPPALGSFTPDTLRPPSESFIIPDIPHSFVDRWQARNKWFTLKFGLVTLFDYTAFTQDQTNIEQVGVQNSQWEVRSARLMLRGTLGHKYKVNYLVSGEYKGFDSEPGENWQMTDVSLTFPINGPATKLTIGKTKETFGYEMVGDAANLPHQERVLSPFFVSRSIGIKVIHVTENQRMTMAAGIFNDWITTGLSFGQTGTDFSARITRLLIDKPDKNEFFHAGLAVRYAGADNGVLRYKGRPESNVSSNFADTGDLPANGATHAGFEALYNKGPFSLTAEYISAWTNTESDGNPRFGGGYITASYVLTGETRPYDRTVGYARRVMPKGRWGAPELVFRLSVIDLDDSDVSGGTFEKYYAGVNWWSTHRWKMGLGWGQTKLDRFNKTGVAGAMLARIQWIY